MDHAHVRSAQSGLRVVALLLAKAEAEEAPLPSAVASLRAGALLAGASRQVVPPPRGAGMLPLEGTFIEDAELLQSMIELLRIDVQEILSEERDRAETLEDYLVSLQSHRQQGEIRLRSLLNREEELQDSADRLERRVDDLRDALDAAVRGGEAVSIAALMSDLSERQQAFVEVQTELVVIERLRASFEEILDPLEERERAVSANRDALLKGVRVVDIPGVDDLGIIVEEGGRLRVRRRR